MTNESFDTPPAVGAGLSARFDTVLRTLARSLEKGAAHIDAQFGHPPAKLVIGGFVVWAFFVAYMVDARTAVHDIAGCVLPGAQ